MPTQEKNRKAGPVAFTPLVLNWRNCMSTRNERQNAWGTETTSFIVNPSPYNSLFKALGKLVKKGFIGLDLWRELWREPGTFKQLAGIADRRLGFLRVAGRIEGAEVVTELYLSLDARFTRAAGERSGNAVFSANYDEEKVADRFLYGLLIGELRHTIYRLLRRSALDKMTIRLPDALKETLAAELPAERFHAAEVMEAVNKLPNKLRFLVVRHFFDGLSVAEAGAELGLRRTNAYTRLSEAIAKIRENLESERGLITK
jgi:hypothetical protein